MNLRLPRMESGNATINGMLRSALLTLAVCMLPLFAMAQGKDVKDRIQPVKFSTEYSDNFSGIIRNVSLQGEKMEYVTSPNLTKAPQRKPEDSKEIKVNVIFDEEVYYFYGASIKEEDGTYHGFHFDWDSSDNIINMDMPVGIYDVLFTFATKDTKQMVYVVKENIDFNQTTELNVDIAEATNAVHFIMRLPNGEIITPQVVRIINGNRDEEIVSEGNISNIRTMCSILCIGANVNKSQVTVPYQIPYDYEESEYSEGFSSEIGSRTILINDVSPNVSIYYYESFFVDGKMHLAESVWHGGDNIEVDNIDVPYVGYDFDFEATPYSHTVVKPEGPRFDPYKDHRLVFSLTGCGGVGWETSMDEIHHVNVAKMSNSSENDLYIYLDNNEYGTFDEDMEFWRYYSVRSGKVFLSDNHEFISIPTEIEYSSNIDFQFPNFYPCPLAYNSKLTDIRNSETAPLWNIRETVWPSLSFNSMGMLGEVRTIDYLDTQIVNLTVDGVDKINEAGFNNGNLRLYARSRQPGQKWEIELRNNNIEVEGLPGHSTINLDFTVKESPNLPVLQQIQYRNSENILTNKFNSSDEGTIILALGNFSHHREMESYFNWYDCDPEAPEVTVEYAPYDTDEWSAIECVEDEDKYFLPCMGHYFSGSLANVNAVSPTHWYDLRVTLLAANGDRQTQVISPAFKIENPSGVGFINHVRDFKVEGNNIISANEIKVIDMNGHQVSGRNLPSGVYVVLTNKEATKVVIR